MKAKYFLLNKIQYAAFVLILIATLLVSTSALAEGGVLDPTFGTNGVVVTDLGSSSDTGINIALQPDGKIIMLGSAQLDSSDPYYRTPIILRYNPDGTLDNTFGTGGKLIISIDRFRAVKVALQSNGKLVVGGSMSGGLALARYTSNGTLDATFGTNGVTIAGQTENGSRLLGDLVIQPDGKIVAAGTWETYGNHYPGVIARFNENGTLDESFGLKIPEFPNGLHHYFRGVALQSDGKIIMSGSMLTEDEGDGTIALGRFTTGPDPWFDPTFGTNGTVVTPLDGFEHGQGALAIQTDGKIVIAGTLYDYSADTGDLVIARYNSNGTPDTTFAGSGIVLTDFGPDDAGNDVEVQRDGKILVAGKTSSNFLLVRYNSDGSLDTTFGDAGKVINNFGSNSAAAMGIAIQPDGKILVGGTKDGDAILTRYGGTPPPATTTTFKSRAPHDGWILESGEFSNVGGLLDKTATTFNVGDDPKDKQYRSIISFNTATLPDNAIVISAQIKIKRQGLVGTDPFSTHANLLLETRNGLFSNDLDVSLSDFAASPSSSTQETFAPLTSSWYAANLSGSNLVLVNKYGVTQFRLRFDLDDNDDLSSDYMKFFAGDATYEADHPQLIVTYVVPQ
jgi:uncharacterized delta-60 repeat protein